MRVTSKLFMAFLPLSVAAGCGLAWLSAEAVHRAATEEAERRAQTLARAYADSAAGALGASAPEGLALERLLGLQRQGASHAMLLDRYGRVLVHSDLHRKGTLERDGPLEDAFASGGPVSRIMSGPPSQVEVTLPLESPRAPEEELLMTRAERARLSSAAIRVRLPLSESLATAKRIGRRVAAAVTCVVVVGGLTGWLVMLRILAPVRRLSEATRSLRDGRLGITVAEDSSDELGALARDFNEMSRRLSEITVSRDYLERVLTQILDAVVVADAGQEIRLINPAAVRMLGGAPGDWIGRPLSEAFAPECRAELETLGERHPVLDAELRARSADGGQIPVLCAATWSAAALNGAPGVVLTLKDITERKRVEELQALREREALQRDFIANVSHEFRTPIAAIRGSVETLQAGALDDPANRLDFIDIIARHAERLSRLVEDLLHLSVLDSKVPDETMELIDLSLLAEEVIDSVRPLARKMGVALRAEIAEGLAVKADAGQLERVLLNLCNNAIYYNRKGGSVRVGARARAGHAEIWIADTGIGIAPDDIPKLFTRFTRTAAAKRHKPEGTGLGLLIAKRIVERHGGLMHVSSVVGEGSTFSLVLPIAAPAFESAQA